MAAERARLRGDAAAGELYERAISAARASRYPHVEAIASELAMHHFQDSDPARAAALRGRAIAAYQAWGAARKAHALEAR